MVLDYVGLCSKLTPLLKGGHEKFLIQSCVSFDQHCTCPTESHNWWGLVWIGQTNSQSILLYFLCVTHWHDFYANFIEFKRQTLWTLTIVRMGEWHFDKGPFNTKKNSFTIIQNPANLKIIGEIEGTGEIYDIEMCCNYLNLQDSAYVWTPWGRGGESKNKIQNICPFLVLPASLFPAIKMLARLKLFQNNGQCVDPYIEKAITGYK